MNAINLFDGLDGLAAGISLFVSLTLLAVSMILRNDIGIFVSLCLSGAVLGFLVFNFNPLLRAILVPDIETALVSMRGKTKQLKSDLPK